MNDTKPFDITSAKAGAPYGCRNGNPATILKWDAQNTDFPLIGTIIFTDGSEHPESWTVNGMRGVGMGEAAPDLVMLPLGYIDGKPVFVGDVFRGASGAQYEATPAERYFTGCRWPEPEKQYPVTQMTARDLVVTTEAANDSQPLRAVANAALRHAIDNGQVATKEAYDQCSRDLGKAERLLEALGYRSAGNGEWEARECSDRDLAIAEAVRSEVLRIIIQNNAWASVYKAIKADLPAIIATVKP
jgi:hypothetical protein